MLTFEVFFYARMGSQNPFWHVEIGCCHTKPVKLGHGFGIHQWPWEGRKRGLHGLQPWRQIAKLWTLRILCMRPYHKVGGKYWKLKEEALWLCRSRKLGWTVPAAMWKYVLTKLCHLDKISKQSVGNAAFFLLLGEMRIERDKLRGGSLNKKEPRIDGFGGVF